MRLSRRQIGLLIGVGALVALVAIAVVAIYTPRVANHFGYVTPLTGRLPDRLSFAGRHYAYHGACASEADLRQFDLWPLTTVGGAPILFGGSRPLLSPPVPAGQTHMVLMVATGSCYRQYTIEGGP